MEVTELINRFKEFFERHYHEKVMECIRLNKKRVTIEFDKLAKFDTQIADLIIDDFEETIKAGEIALEGYMAIDEKHNINLRIKGDIPNKVRLRDLRAKHLGKFMTLEGTIETKSDIGIRMTSTKYECPSCGAVIPVLQLGDVAKEPTKCGCGRKGKFIKLSMEMLDVFTLRLQELSSAIKYGSNMKVLSILCKEDLSDTIIEEKLVEGIRVKINGLYKEKELLKQGIKQTQLLTYFEANYIHISDETFYDLVLTKKDITEIKEFSKKKDLIKKIHNGLFQGILGNDKIKEALTLQAFGGVSNYEATPKLRGDIHILLVGDTGQNKSVFMEYVQDFSPKSVLSMGKTVSAVGLGGCPIKDELSGGFVLKPGAIALANNGTILIDELDKMNKDDWDILLEPMERQCITFDKGNIHRTLIARDSFLVSMNPKNGFFNNFDAIYSQILLPDYILNRFDQVFIIKKKKHKSDEIMKEEKEKARLMMTRSDKGSQEKLKEFQSFMRKYIAYAKQNIFPLWNSYLAEEYIPGKYAAFDNDMKGGDVSEKTFPISPRHLFVIKRIAEARRRIFLDGDIRKEDVDYAIEKLKGSFEDFAMDIKTGTLDYEYISDGIPSSAKKLIYVFEEVYNELEQEQGKLVDSEVMETKLKDKGFSEVEIELFLQKQKDYGNIFEPRRGFIQKI